MLTFCLFLYRILSKLANLGDSRISKLRSTTGGAFQIQLHYWRLCGNQRASE